MSTGTLVRKELLAELTNRTICERVLHQSAVASLIHLLFCSLYLIVVAHFVFGVPGKRSRSAIVHPSKGSPGQLWKKLPTKRDETIIPGILCQKWITLCKSLPQGQILDRVKIFLGTHIVKDEAYLLKIIWYFFVALFKRVWAIWWVGHWVRQWVSER